jgi:hypothetical protein
MPWGVWPRGPKNRRPERFRHRRADKKIQPVIATSTFSIVYIDWDLRKRQSFRHRPVKFRPVGATLS